MATKERTLGGGDCYDYYYDLVIMIIIMILIW